MEILYMLLGAGITIFLLGLYSTFAINKNKGIRYVGSTGSNDEEVHRTYNRAKLYFCTDDMFDFEKFCDYILCIKDNMSMSDYTEMALDLEVLNQSIPDIHKDILPITLFVTKFTEYSYKDFEKMQDDIRENKYTGFNHEIVYMLMITTLYIKHKTIELRENV